jgi:hypothetical protein
LVSERPVQSELRVDLRKTSTKLVKSWSQKDQYKVSEELVSEKPVQSELRVGLRKTSTK